MPANPVPILVFGQIRSAATDVATLLRYGNSSADKGAPVMLFGRTAEAAVAGVGGRASFDRLFIGVTFTHPFTIKVTPITDGKINATEFAHIEVTQADFDDPANELVAGERVTHLFEVTLSEPYFRGGQERSRHALMGTYFQVEVEQLLAMPDGGELIVEGIELEYQVLTQSQVA